MPTRPHHHPLADLSAAAGRRSTPARVIERRHRRPTPGGVPVPPSDPTPSRGSTADGREHASSEDGSVATEYGLLAVVAATIVSVLLEWATSGGISALLGSILDRVSDLVGL